MRNLDGLLNNNRAWAQRVTAEDPQFFRRLAEQQAPDILWIGCSDSRVPATQIVDLLPGEIFVHRNVANLIVHSDLSCLSALQFAVDVLAVQHIVVCGHYGCSGIAAAIRRERHGLIDNWLRHVQDISNSYRTLLNSATLESDKSRMLTELNVITQVTHVAATTIVQDAWANGRNVVVHGWIYDVADGLLHDLEVSIARDSNVEMVVKLAINRIRLTADVEATS